MLGKGYCMTNEERIRSLPTEELAEKEEELKAARLTVRMLRKSIKSIKAILE